MKTTADRSLTTPNRPLRNSEDDTEVNPADMKMTGASRIVLALVIWLDASRARESRWHTVCQSVSIRDLNPLKVSDLTIDSV